jgi:hypothetical protein
MNSFRVTRHLTAMMLVIAAEDLPAPEVDSRGVCVDTVKIYLLADRVHTGLAFDLKWLESSGFVKPAEIGDHQMVVMSWGDETAYVQKRGLSPKQVFRALFLPTPSVMECIPIDWKVEEVCAGQRVFAVDVPRSSGRALANFLNGHSETDVDGSPLTVGPSSWGGGRLIRCPDHYPYDVSRMCNDWTAEALRITGVRIEAGAVLSAEGLVRLASSQGSGFLRVGAVELPVAQRSPDDRGRKSNGASVSLSIGS